MNDFDTGGFLNTALNTGLSYFGRNETPKPAPAPAPKDNGIMKWVLIGGGILVAVLTLGLIFKGK
jgi:hypothetical protein